MNIRFARHRFQGERVVQTAPELSIRVSGDWYRRPCLYTGRALTDNTLILNTKHHIRHLQLFGRHLSKGIIYGLELSYYQKTYLGQNREEEAEQWLRLTAGIGLTCDGEDVSLPDTTDIYLENVFSAKGEDPPRGTGVFVLEPLEIIDEIIKDEQDQCQWDKERDPFDDEQIIDGCRLVFYPWPTETLGPSPPVQAKHFRNQTAYQIYDYEIDHPDDLLPWEYVGVPLGLSYITNKGKILFIDQHAVTRQGGAPLTTNPLLDMNGTPFLWEARIRQFISQLYDISQQVDEIPAVQSYFEVLPPVGMLPKQALNIEDMSTEFFPSQFIVDAVPIPEEQLEVAMNASSGLRPFDLYQPEKIKLLVPVPQAVYEPDLLKKEAPDPIFLETLRKLVQQIRRWLANRNFLRNMSNKVIGAINFSQVPAFTDDLDAIPDEKIFRVPVSHDEGITEYGGRAKQAIQDLRTWITDHTNVAAKDIEHLVPSKVGAQDFMGLEHFIRDLEKKIEQTEDYLNSGFVKTEVDMYRLRQLLLGNIKASRLATSPALGKIVGGQTGIPSVENVERYFNTAVAKPLGLSTQKLTPIMMTPQDVVGKTEDEKITYALNIIKKREAGEKLQTRDLLFAASTIASVLAERVGDGSKTVSMLARPDRVKFDDDEVLFVKPEPSQVVGIYHKPVLIPHKQGLTRDKSMVDRIYESPAMEVKSNTVKTKSNVFESLAKVPLEIDEEVTIVSSDMAVLTLSGYENILAGLGPDGDLCKNVLEKRARQSDDLAVFYVTSLTEEEKKTLSDDQQTELENIFAANRGKNRVFLKDEKLGRSIREGMFDPDPTDGDEANYFSTGVTALEHGLEAIRAVDRKLDEYKKALNQCKKVLNDLWINSKQWKDALHEADDKLTELRHDALVTRSLFDEERARLKAINEQRKAILENYVTTLAFVRPRLVDTRLDAPSIQLYGEYINPVPACLAEDFEATDELEDMLDVFREVPINWLKEAKTLVRLVDYPSKIVDIMKHASDRTYKLINAEAISQPMTYQAYNPNEFGNAVNSLVHANQQYKQTFYKEKAKIDLAQFNTKTWVDLVQQAEKNLSLADLIEAGKGKSALAKKAIIVMENIEDVAVCLYHRCNEVEPAIKLQWANLISVFDKPIDLRYLEVLPAWERIDFIFRRDLQNMVDWLFSQVEADISQARKLMNDLVRVCILLASHAPVSTIIRGYAPEPATGKIGDIIDLVIDKGRVKVGMVATVFTDDAVAVQGIVADVGKGAARIKITQAKGGATEFSIDKGAQVKFHKSKARRYVG